MASASMTMLNKSYGEKIKGGKSDLLVKSLVSFQLIWTSTRSAGDYDPEDNLRDPRYVREAKYIFIKKEDVPDTIEQTAENIEFSI